MLTLGALLLTVHCQTNQDLPDGSPIVYPEISIQNISNIAEYYSIAGSKGNTLVVLYEQWCGYSQVTLKLLDQLKTDQEFLKTKTKIAIFDIYKEKKFKAIQSIKQVPVVILFKDGHEIHYSGLKNYPSLFQFLEKKLEMDTVKEVSTLAEFDELKNGNRSFFLYFGERNTHRFKMFLTGHYEYSKSLFFQTNDPYIQDKYNLDDNQIYYFNAQDKSQSKYGKAFKRERWLKWIALIIGRKYVHINSNSYDFFLRSENPHLILFKDNSPDSETALQKFTSNYESYFETVEGAICNESEPGCQEFTNRVGASKFEGLERPFLIIMTVSKVTPDPLIYFYPKSKKVTKKNLKKFISDFKDKKIEYSSFSEPIPEKVEKAQIQKVVKDSMNRFFLDNFNVDLVMLFYDSRMCQQACTQRFANQFLCNTNPKQLGEYSKQCDRLLERYNRLVEKLRSHSGDQGENIRFFYFDLGKNSHHLYQIGKKSPVMRIYKLGKFDNFVDHVIPDSLDNFDNDVVHFLLDTTTQDLKLHEIDEEQDM